MYFALILLGSLLPDIDHKKSTLGRFNPFARYMKHRGWTHTIFGCVTLSSPMLLFDINFFTYLLIGCLSHIFGDRLHSIFTKSKFKIRFW